ncbi:hypothetical protein VARIO8X_100285 [Burkholderiales bacterium 8X]|nr:hypothetical protein VARIO8X_100285 [Burkholderiales bacterium 8X]
MAAGGMAGDGDSVRIAAMRMDVPEGPDQSPDHFERDVGDRDRLLGRAGAQRIVGHHHAETFAGEVARDKRMVALVERPPPAAVDEEQHRRAARAAAEDIQGFVRRRRVVEVELAIEEIPRLRGLAGPAREVVGMVGNQRPVVVHPVQPRGIVGNHSNCSRVHEAPILARPDPPRPAPPVLRLKIAELWGGSSAGRAPRSQCGGREFEPHPLHQRIECPTETRSAIGGTTVGHADRIIIERTESAGRTTFQIKIRQAGHPDPTTVRHFDFSGNIVDSNLWTNLKLSLRSLHWPIPTGCASFALLSRSGRSA